MDSVGLGSRVARDWLSPESRINADLKLPLKKSATNTFYTCTAQVGLRELKRYKKLNFQDMSSARDLDNMYHFLKSHDRFKSCVIEDQLRLSQDQIQNIILCTTTRSCDRTNIFYNPDPDLSEADKKKEKHRMMHIITNLAMTDPEELPNYNPDTKKVERASFW